MARLTISRSVVKYQPQDDTDDGIRWSTSSSFSAPLVVGGARSSVSLRHAAGIILGKPTRAARDLAVPLLEAKDFGSWATRQASTLNNSLREVPRDTLVSLIAELHGQTGNLHIAESCVGKMTFLDVLEFCTARDRVILLHDAGWGNYVRDGEGVRYDKSRVPKLNGDVLLTSGGRGSPLDFPRHTRDDMVVEWNFKGEFDGFIQPNSLTGLSLRAIAQAWSVSERDVFSVYEKSATNRRVESVGYVGDKKIRLRVLAVFEREILVETQGR